ncbi:MAG: DNA translocase FtsK 4TM domain-containing protein [Bacteroidales bacterium]|nr:DNA translocase FtsK 4TM domain-containing protein [Bacteroidales bacterium]
MFDDEQDVTLSAWKKTVGFLKSDTLHFVIGLCSVVFALYLLFACGSYLNSGAADQSFVNEAANGQVASNSAGNVGARVASFLINDCFGLASVFILVFFAVAGASMMGLKRVKLLKWFFCCFFLLVWFSIAIGFTCSDFYQDSFFYWGGLHGHKITLWLTNQIGWPGVALLLLLTAICFLVYVSKKTIDYIRKMFSFSSKQKIEEGLADVQVGTNSATEDIDEEEKKTLVENEASLEDSEEEVEDTECFTEEETVRNPASGKRRVRKTEKSNKPEEEGAEVEEPEFVVHVNAEDQRYQESLKKPYNPRLDLENYKFPLLSLLKDTKEDQNAVSEEELNTNKDSIVKALQSFNVEISSICATVGPTVTLYEITPAPGIRISRIQGLEKDIALNLAALGVRIIAPIPGKNAIGIEVPNKRPQIVSGRSIIGSRKFQESEYDLPVALGKTITNEVFMVDLAKMPHVLVAGATGQGKSVGLNAIITSLLYKKHPAELKFVMIDPKKVEFSIYSSIEHHYLAELPDSEPIITDVKKVVQTLNSLCKEMDSRYDLLKSAQVRNIKEYNEKFINRKLNPEKGHRYLPYIVVIIDEFGDLIMTAGREVELPIARIAQLARAVGIHMVIATQRPTTNIITGTIKANFPARIAFRVSAMVDSRTILDRPGANQLIGRGDLLFLQGMDPIRVQCAFIDTPEVEEITKFIAKQQGYVQPFYLPEVEVESGSDDTGSGSADVGRLDPLFEDAARLIMVHNQGSTSLIQRKFSIGYNRAGRLMDQLEKMGVVGPPQGAKPREVLITSEEQLMAIMENYN